MQTRRAKHAAEGFGSAAEPPRGAYLAVRRLNMKKGMQEHNVAVMFTALNAVLSVGCIGPCGRPAEDEGHEGRKSTSANTTGEKVPPPATQQTAPYTDEEVAAFRQRIPERVANGKLSLDSVLKNAGIDRAKLAACNSVTYSDRAGRVTCRLSPSHDVSWVLDGYLAHPGCKDCIVDSVQIYPTRRQSAGRGGAEPLESAEACRRVEEIQDLLRTGPWHPLYVVLGRLRLSPEMVWNVPAERFNNAVFKSVPLTEKCRAVIAIMGHSTVPDAGSRWAEDDEVIGVSLQPRDAMGFLHDGPEVNPTCCTAAVKP